MQRLKIIAVFFMILGFALGSTVGIAVATEHAFADPCPMEHQNGDMPCCPDDCTDAMLTCSAKCASSVTVGSLPLGPSGGRSTLKPKFEAVRDIYDGFAADPPTHIPIV